MGFHCHRLLGLTTLVVQEAWSRTTTADPFQSQPPSLEFYGGQFRKLGPEDLPRRVCITDERRPAWWAWPFANMRLRIIGLEGGLSTRTKLRFRRSSPARGLCTVFDTDFLLCKDCPTCVHETSRPVFGTNDLAVNLPPRGGCIYLDEFPDGVNRLQVTWEQHLDPAVVMMLVVGLFCTWGWQSLRESRLLHATIGSIGFLAVIITLIAWYVISNMPSMVHNQASVVPLGRLATILMTFMFAFVPSVRDTVIGWILPTTPFDWREWVQLRDPFFDLPVGWIITIAAIVVGSLTLWAARLGAYYSMQYFASAPDPIGQVDFRIGRNGARIDLLPPTPTPQWILGLVIWVSGLTLLLFSTHSDVFSVVLVMFVLAKDYLWHFANTWFMGMDVTQPGKFRNLVSMAEYEREGHSHTAKALQALQRHVMMDPKAIRSVREDSELRLRRFSEGAPHFHWPFELQLNERKQRCIVL